MRKITADCIYPITSDPIKNGLVIIDDTGKILSVEPASTSDPAELEIYHGIICPGFINAHCHLELSYMKGKIPERKGLAQFIIDLIDYRNGFALVATDPGEHSDIIVTEIKNAEHEMKNEGIVGVGDISNDDFTFRVKSVSSLAYHTFIECFGFFPDKAAIYFSKALELFRQARNIELMASITPHAPYSVSPELFELIFAFGQNHPSIYSYHNQESKAEDDFSESFSGDLIQMLNHFKIPLNIFRHQGLRSLPSLIRFFPQADKTLFVHNTFSESQDIELINNRNPNAFFCFCPSANLYIEDRLPDFKLFRKLKGKLCVGTDSYASNHQLSILEELKIVQNTGESFSTQDLLEWATINGANFFGWSTYLGSLEKGKTPGLNLITNVDKNSQFTPDSKIQKLVG